MSVSRIISKNLYSVGIVLGDGVVDAEVYVSKNNSPESILLFHGDPNWGATMYDKPVNDLFHAFKKKEYNVMRINFIKHIIINDNYDKYISQASVCLEEFFNYIGYSNIKLFFVGYSFGSLIALNMLLRRPEAFGVVLISPALTFYDYLWVTPCKNNGAIIYGSQDNTMKIDPSASGFTKDDLIRNFANLCKINKIEMDVSVIFGADHYFSGRTSEMTKECLKYIEKFSAMNNFPKSE